MGKMSNGLSALTEFGFTIGGLEIRWYGIIIAAGILVAFLVAAKLFKKAGYKDSIVYWILLICIPAAIVGARIYYVLFNLNDPDLKTFGIINIRKGGIAIYGGIIGGCLALFIIARVKKCGFFTLADVCAVALILAQSIGRWGNFMNKEVYGFEVASHAFPFTVDIYGTPHLATFFLESILNLGGFILLLYVLSRQKKWGTTSAVYLIFYGCVRAILEPLRDPEYILKINPKGSGIVFNQVSFMISLVIIALGVLILFANKKGWVSQRNETVLKEE